MHSDLVAGPGQNQGFWPHTLVLIALGLDLLPQAHLSARACAYFLELQPGCLPTWPILGA